MNLTNIEETPLHAAFDACCESAEQTRAARHRFGSRRDAAEEMSGRCRAGIILRKQKWSEGAAEEELIDIAIRSMGLSELKPFDPKEKVIEFKMESTLRRNRSCRLNLRQFCNETLSDSPAPGGGSVAALMGALGASLGGMVANLSAGKRGWDEKLEYFSEWAVKAQQLKDELLFLVDEDTAAFNKVMAAFGAAERIGRRKGGALRGDPSGQQICGGDSAAGDGNRDASHTNCSRRWRRKEIRLRFPMSASVCSRRAPALKARR